MIAPTSKKSLLSGILALSSGNVIGQLLLIASSPILTRLYEPHDFGILGVYISLVAFLAAVCSLRYELGIVIPESNRAAGSIVALCFYFLALFMLLITLLGGMARETVFSWKWITGMEQYIAFFLAGVLIAGTHKIFSFWILRQRQYSALALSKMFQDGAMSIIQIFAGWLKLGTVGLLSGHLVGGIVGLSILGRSFLNRETVENVKPRCLYLKYSAIKYVNFLKYTVWADMLGIAARQLPVVFLAMFFSPSAAGFYALAHRVANVPVAFLSDSTGRVLVSEVSRVQKNEEKQRLAFNTFETLLHLSLIPFFIAMLFSRELFELIFGTQWGNSGYYLTVLVPHLFAVFIFVPLMTLIPLLGMQKIGFIFQSALLLSTLLAFGVGKIYFTGPQTIASMSVLHALLYGVCGLRILLTLGVSVQDFFYSVLRAAWKFIPIFLACLFLKWALIVSYSHLLLIGGIGIVVIGYVVVGKFLTMRKLKEILGSVTTESK